MHLASASDRYPRSCSKEGRAEERERHEQGRGPEPSMIAHEKGPGAPEDSVATKTVTTTFTAVHKHVRNILIRSHRGGL